MKFKSLVILIAAAMFLNAAGNSAKQDGMRSAPRLLNYQGFLTDTLSNPITDPSVSMTFAIFDAVSSGNLKWTEIQGSVGVDKGIFHILLGSVNPIPDSVFRAGTDRWLELTIGGQALSPRTRVVSVPYAYSATYSDTALYALNATSDNDWTISGNNQYSAVSGNVGIGTTNPLVKLDVNGVICGGIGDTASGTGVFIGGGFANKASGTYSLVGGGDHNVASGGTLTWEGRSVVAGGTYNTASGIISIVGGGEFNNATALRSIVVGGRLNRASGDGSIIVGGMENLTAGVNSAILSGYADTITSSGNYSYLFGIRSKLTQDSTFMVDMPHVWFGTEVNGYEFPYGRGTDGQVMKTNGSGILSWGSITYVDSARVAANAHKLQGKDTVNFNIDYVNEGQVNSIDSLMLQNNAVTMPKIAPAGATAGQVIKWNGTAWQPGADSSIDSDWSYRVTDGADTTLQMGGRWGLARFGNTMYGNADSTHVNLGIGSATGRSGEDNKYCTVGGGIYNTASGYGATVDGGRYNKARGQYSVVSGGGAPNESDSSSAIGDYSVIGGGLRNRINGAYATIGGGFNNVANGYVGTVAGGSTNAASGYIATVGGGSENIASSFLATVSGGSHNTASDTNAIVGGGYYNYAGGKYSAILGGYADSIAATGDYSYLFGINSNLTQDSTFMVDMPHVWFGTEANGYEFPYGRGSNGQIMVTNGSGLLSWGSITYVDSARVSANTYKLQGKDTVNFNLDYVNEGQVNSIMNTMVQDAAVTMPKIAQAGATAGQVIKWNGTAWQPAADSSMDNDWTYRVTDGADTTLQMGGRWGIARAGNTLYGNADSTHVNLGVACTTGTVGNNFKYTAIAGGMGNSARNDYATVGGGYQNIASNNYAIVGGGIQNIASGWVATVGGGVSNQASNEYATVSGGSVNIASGIYAIVGGGRANKARGQYSVVGGGGGIVEADSNSAMGDYSSILGGRGNKIAATGNYSYLFGINSNLTQDSIFMVDMPHVWFGTEAGGYEFPYGRGTDGQVMKTNGSGLLSWGSIAYVDSARVATNAHKLQGKDTVDFNVDYVNEGQVNSIDSLMLQNNAVTMPKIAPAGATAGQVIKWNGTAWQPGADSSMDSDWSYRVTDGADTTLQTGGRWGIVRFGNTMYGNADSTHVNLGVGSTTGTNGQNYKYITVGGGYGNTAIYNWTTIGGGDRNTAGLSYATVSGGVQNNAGGQCATVGGGSTNIATSECATVAGGNVNTASNYNATVSGGQGNIASGYIASVGGGKVNRARGAYSVVSGGGGGNDADSNSAIGDYSAIGGGYRNIARGFNAVIGGGQSNAASGTYATLGGGQSNTASGNQAFVGGGNNNRAIGFQSTVGGGVNNTASGSQTSTVGGGWGNTASNFHTTVGGGCANIASGENATVGGGNDNKATGDAATVGGGVSNTASGSWSYAIVGGGRYNTASNSYATVGGGQNDTASGYASTVTGGVSNRATGNYGAVVGGANNRATGSYATVGAGINNTASGHLSTVAGGQNNTAADSFNFIGGGYLNSVSGKYSVILGGYADTISAGANYSYLFGINSNLTQDSTFLVDMPHVWFGTEANGYEFPYGRGTNGQALVTNGSGQVSWASTNDNDWVINGSNMYAGVSGNVGIGITIPSTKLDVAGTVKIADGTQALGRVFTSDANGLGSWQALPAAPVTSVFGRTGAVVAASGDYTTTLVTEGTNLYFTDARAQAAITGGASTIATSNLTANRALLSDGSGKVAVSITTNTELGYLSGATSAIQTQINGKQEVITGGASTIATSNLTANRALLSDGSGKVAVSAATNTELGYLSGVTSAIQTQLSGKAPTSSPTFTGNVTMPGTGIWNSSGNVGIGLTSPSAKLDVAGTVKIADGTQALGRVFTSDANGLGSWQAIPNDNDWTYRITDGADTTLQMGGRWGLARAGNTLYGNADSTHVNLGLGSVTGTTGQDYKYCTVGGGYLNTAAGDRATVSGGTNNTASGIRSTIGGGWYNTASNFEATVGGGTNNNAGGNQSIIAGGGYNVTIGTSSAIGGGYGNTTGGTAATVAGGQNNMVSSSFGFVGGGAYNKSRGEYSVVSGGGSNNEADSNSAIGDYSAIGGGSHNITSGVYATVGGGFANTTSGYATIGGGNGNTAGEYATVAGGFSNTANNYYATIGGGGNNFANGERATVAGGASNRANGNYSAVSGGQNNSASDSFGFVGAGYLNSAEGKYSAILGGYADTITAGANYSYLFGINSNLTQDSTFLVDMPHIRFGTEATGYEFPTTDGSNGQVMRTNGAGQLSWGALADADWTISGSNMYSAVSGNVGIGASSPAVRLEVRAGTSDTAAIFRGNLVIQSKATGNAVLELGEGLDYAEGFDVTQPDKIKPGTVLVINPQSPGKLAISSRAYDTKVAGIVAGGKGLGSGVRLGTGDFDHNVALAGRVYCNVDASTSAVEPGDLLTTASTPGYAMKAQNYDRAKGAVLGKAMERLEKGQKGQILVLVSLQ